MYILFYPAFSDMGFLNLRQNKANKIPSKFKQIYIHHRNVKYNGNHVSVIIWTINTTFQTSFVLHWFFFLHFSILYLLFYPIIVFWSSILVYFCLVILAVHIPFSTWICWVTMPKGMTLTLKILNVSKILEGALKDPH